MSSLKKYEFTGDVKEFYGRTLRRIRAVRDFGDVKAGDLGGWIESEINLSHDGTAWVYDEARVFDKARVDGEARVYGEARVFGGAWVGGEARVFDKARVDGEARVYGEARVFGGAWVGDEAQVCDKARVYGEAMVLGEAWVYGEAQVYGKAWVYDKSRMFGEVSVTRNPITAQLTRDPIVATDNHIQIGCRLRTYEHWLANYEAIGREAGYSEDDIALYGDFIKLLNIRIKLQ